MTGSQRGRNGRREMKREHIVDCIIYVLLVNTCMMLVPLGNRCMYGGARLHMVE